ncbi:MAG: cadherin-like beta sandwich domain-containing protein [Oscillospiraceae bacterium]|nr:cadherin-like beta sandwich domain-containing protein [Oscillospiraceae bacterium]
MKKQFSFLARAFLTLALVFALLPQPAHAASGSLSSDDSSLRAGDTFTLTYKVSGSGILGLESTLSYDSEHLSLVSSKNLLGSSWTMSQNGNNFTLYNNDGNKPINSSKSALSVTFKVKSGVAAGTSVSASISTTASDGSDIALGTAKWSAKILAPLSSNAKLDSLTCSNGTLSPSFSSDTTSYKMTVPYSVKSLDLDWDTAHSGASASVSGNSLSVGSNTVTVKVTAEDGTTKRYTITVTREQDPNYVPSTDAALASLKPSASRLSPKFSPDITDYVVYVTHEVETVELEATARDGKAKGVKHSGSTTLVEGENLLSVTCTAEDGKTAVTYTVHVIRMPLYEGVLPEIIPPVTEPVVEPEPEPEPEPTTYDISLPLMLTLPYIGEVTLQQAALGALIALGLILLLLLLIAWAIGRRGGRKKAMKKMAKAKAAEEAALVAAAAAAEERTPAEEAAPESPTAEGTPCEEAPIEEVPAEETPAEETPAEETPSEETPTAEETDSVSPAEEAVILGAAAAEAIEEESDQPEELPAEEEPAPKEDNVSVAGEDLPAEEPPAEAPAEPADDAPAEPAVEEETSVDDHPENADASEATTEDFAPAEDAAPEATAEDPAPAQPELPADEQPASRRGSLDELGGMTLDELLEDIRNM